MTEDRRKRGKIEQIEERKEGEERIRKREERRREEVIHFSLAGLFVKNAH